MKKKIIKAPSHHLQKSADAALTKTLTQTIKGTLSSTNVHDYEI